MIVSIDVMYFFVVLFFFFNDTATTEIYTLSLHDALPISVNVEPRVARLDRKRDVSPHARRRRLYDGQQDDARVRVDGEDRKSTRLNSSHANISYAVFCLKKKKKTNSVLNTHITQTQ